MNTGPFDVENRVWTFLNKLTDIFLLGVLGFAFSVPVVTAGAAAVGFYYGVMRISSGTDAGIFHDFIGGFRKSWRTATAAWLIQIGVTALLAVNMWVSLRVNTPVAWFVLGLNAVLFLSSVCVSIFVYPMAARYRFGVKKILCDSAVIACAHLPCAFGLLLMIAAGIAASVCVRYVYMIAPAAVGYQIARVCVRIFGKYERVGEGNTKNESGSEEKE